ncbi:MAG: hypothetical protein LC737_07485, partial [Chloroflexi bacterium]|nr:hypothetical protein [Chloroflexota bacterium]
TYRAPSAGRLLAEHNGEVLLELAPALLELPANVKGSVISAARFGVALQTAGALVQGVWGNGKENYGVLKWLGSSREQPLTADVVDVSCLGMIVAVGGTITASGLRQAEAQQVRGVIAGSMSARLRETACALPFPIMLTEGFGAFAMAEPAFGLMRNVSGREGGLRAVWQTRWGAQRPDLVVPEPFREDASDDAAPSFAVLRRDVEVRVCAGDQFGRNGRVLSEQPRSRVLASGVRAAAVEVALSNGERVWVPINNLEAMV